MIKHDKRLRLYSRIRMEIFNMKWRRIGDKPGMEFDLSSSPPFFYSTLFVSL